MYIPTSVYWISAFCAAINRALHFTTLHSTFCANSPTPSRVQRAQHPKLPHSPQQTCTHAMYKYSWYSSTPHMAVQRSTPHRSTEQRCASHCLTYRDLLLKNPHTNRRGYENGINVIFCRFVFIFYDFFLFVCETRAVHRKPRAMKRTGNHCPPRTRAILHCLAYVCVCVFECSLDCAVCYPLVLLVCRNASDARCGRLFLFSRRYWYKVSRRCGCCGWLNDRPAEAELLSVMLTGDVGRKILLLWFQ